MTYRKPVIPSVGRTQQVVSSKPTELGTTLESMNTGQSHIRIGMGCPGSEFRALLSKDIPLYSSFSPDGIFHPAGSNLHTRLVEARRAAVRMLTQPPTQDAVPVRCERSLPEVHPSRRQSSQLSFSEAIVTQRTNTTLRHSKVILPSLRTMTMKELDIINAVDPICFSMVPP